MSKLLYSIQEIFGDYLKEQGQFVIPNYQRGYKWEGRDVVKLLEDISKFQPGNGKFYCLQNITIVPAGNHFHVVDGQQRLTTLTVLLALLGRPELVKGKVVFPSNSIRKKTNEFLETYVIGDSAKISSYKWESFIHEQPSFDHQDIAHIFQAYKEAKAWFDRNASIIKSEFLSKLMLDVKIIVNLVTNEANEEKIFGNLNSKRIPLDGADLVRAILITRVAYEEGKRENDIKNIVRVNERRVKIGWELDQINNWWGRADVRDFFSSFIGIRSEELAGQPLFRKEKYPLNLLLLLFAEQKNQAFLNLDFIEQKNHQAIALYKEIIKLNSTFQDWYQDLEIYHYLGFLFNQAEKVQFSKIWEDWVQFEDRVAFKERLKDRIKEAVLDKEDSAFLPFSAHKKNWYDNEPIKLRLIRALILLDVIHASKLHQRLPPKAFKKGQNDIEHIFPQNPKEQKDKKRYLDFLNRYVEGERTFDLSEFDAMKDDEDYQAAIQSYILEKTSSIPTHSIGNLVLLDAGLNRSISNNPYAQKRARVIQHFNEGYFIQPHTFKVFARYFLNETRESQELEHWNKKDIDANAKQIERTINIFFNIQQANLTQHEQ